MDVRRAQVSLQETLADVDAIRQRIEGCGDRRLRVLLNSIAQGRARHASTLLSWLQRRAPAFDPLTAQGESQDPEVLETDVRTARSGYRVEVIERRDITADLLVLKVPRPPGFAFIPGQAAKLMLNGIRRDYSIVSAPHEPFLEFFIELVPGGPMSERLRKLAKGGFLTLQARPKGKFILDARYPHHLMVATVTGVNPFISILRAYLHEGRQGQRFYLLHGASYQDEFGYKDELQRMAGAHPEVLTYIPTVSRPEEARNATWTGERGRVDTLVDKYLDQFALDSGSTLLYACGNPGMVDEVESRFRPQGFAIKVERYT